MNTENIYFGKVYEVTSVDRNAYLGTFIHFDYVKPALVVLRKNIFGMKYMKDLNTGEKYRVKLSTKKGNLYVSGTSRQSFNEVTNNKQTRLPKEKVRTLGNRYL